MDIKIVNDQGEEIKQTQSEVHESDTSVVADGVMLVEQLGQLFNLRPNEIGSNKHMIQTLIDYAKLRTDDHSPEGLKWALRQLNVKVGTAPMGEKNINYLYRYAKLYLESKRIEAEKERYLKGERDD